MVGARDLYTICDKIYYAEIQSDIRRIGHTIGKAIEREFEQAGIPLYDVTANDAGEQCGKMANPVKLLAYDRLLALAQGELGIQTLFSWALPGDDLEKTP